MSGRRFALIVVFWILLYNVAPQLFALNHTGLRTLVIGAIITLILAIWP